MKKQEGFSLIEVMVALVIAAVMTTGITNYQSVTTRSAYTLLDKQEEYLEVQNVYQFLKGQGCNLDTHYINAPHSPELIRHEIGSHLIMIEARIHDSVFYVPNTCMGAI
jgi:prepilin-type N-terminal cleavage/methylation domain-containing protein